MEIAGVLTLLTVLGVVLFGGFKAGFEAGHRRLSERLGHLAVRVAQLDAEVKRLDAVTLQWSTDGHR